MEKKIHKNYAVLKRKPKHQKKSRNPSLVQNISCPLGNC